MPKLLTAAAASKLKPDPNGKRLEVRDGGAPGLHLVIQPSGYKSWVLRGRRPNGKHAKVTLGPLDLSGTDEGEPTLGRPLSLRAARVLANQLLGMRAKGIDVAEAKVELSRRRVAGSSFVDVVKEFVADYARPNNRSWKITAKTLGLIYPEGSGQPALLKNGLAMRWAAKPIAEITSAAIWDVVAETRRKGTPGTAPRKSEASDSRGLAMAAALGSLFSWATKNRLIAVNPSLGLHRPPQPNSRSRVLTDVEIRALWQACGEFGFPFGAATKLLLITGQRRREVTGMRRSELSDDLSVWNIPPSRTKNKMPHAVFLPSLAQEIIEAVPRIVGTDLIFTTNGRAPISGFSKFKSDLDGEIKNPEPWRIHDLRRTAVTHMAELGIQPHVIEAIVNHLSGHKRGIAGIYNKAVYAAERKAALKLWADRIATIVGGL